MARAESEADQSTRVGHRLRLPAMIRLIAAHRVFTGLIPASGRRGAKVVLPDQSCLNSLGAFGINFLLTSHSFLLPVFPCLALALPAGAVEAVLNGCLSAASCEGGCVRGREVEAVVFAAAFFVCFLGFDVFFVLGLSVPSPVLDVEAEA